MRIKADEVIVLFDENKNKNVCFHVIGVVDVESESGDSSEIFVLLLPEQDDSKDLDSESPLLIMRFLTQEQIFESIEDTDEFNKICDLVLNVLNSSNSENPLYINGEPVINTFEL